MKIDELCCPKCSNNELLDLPTVVGGGWKVFVCEKCKKIYLNRDGELKDMPLEDAAQYLTLLAIKTAGLPNDFYAIKGIETSVLNNLIKYGYEDSNPKFESIVDEEITRAFEVARANPRAYPISPKGKR